MYNVTAMVALLNDNSYLINAFATIVQALATIGLLAVTCLLWKVYKETNTFVGKQTYIMDEQLSIINEQTNVVQDELKAIKEERDYQMLIEKYRRLRDEMDYLVNPLYVHACSYNKEKFEDDRGENGYFTTYRFKDRGAGRKEIVTNIIEFWDNIHRNIYLSGSNELSHFLQCHFKYIQKYNIHSGDFEQTHRSKFNENVSSLVESIKRRYEHLGKEIADIEQRLGIQKDIAAPII